MFDAYHDPEAGCLEGTRVELLAKLMQWIEDITANVAPDRNIYEGMYLKKVIWLYGLAGSGKSTIANSIATIVKRQGYHYARFFCKRDHAGRSSVKRIFPTLSYQLTLLYPEYREAVLKLLNGPDNGDVLKGILGSQVEELFTKTLSGAKEPKPLVLIIDALDECGDAEAQTKIITGLIAISKAVPWVKIFVTSRDEVAIRDRFGEDSSGNCHKVNINELQDIDEDIQRFTEFKLEKLGLDKNQANSLAKKAGGLFIWSSTVFKFLEGRLNPRKELARLIKDDGSASEPLQQLYSLYDKVLESVPYQQKGELAVVRRILAIVYVSSTTTPLSASTIAMFLQRDPLFFEEGADSVERVVRSLHAVVYEDNDGSTIRAYHPSFLDYLVAKLGRHGWNMLSLVHQQMFEASLAIMLEKLRFNICGLKNTSLLNADVGDLDRLIIEYIPCELQYSCEHWFTHLCNSGLSGSDITAQATVSRLLCDVKILFWLEVLSLTGAIERSVPTLQQCGQFFHVGAFSPTRLNAPSLFS